MTSFHVIRIRLELELDPYDMAYICSQIPGKSMGKSMYLDEASHVFGMKEGCISTFWVAVLGLGKGHAWGKESSRAGNKD